MKPRVPSFISLPETVAISLKGGNNAPLATPTFCSLCPAKYSNFLIRNPNQARDHLRETLLTFKTPEIAVPLDHPSILRFVEPHWLDWKTALENCVDSHS